MAKKTTPPNLWHNVIGKEKIENGLMKVPQHLRYCRRIGETVDGEIEQGALGSFGELAEKVTGTGEPPTPMCLWGKDHWSTLGYIETCCVDHPEHLVNEVLGDESKGQIGRIDHRRMRTDQMRHAELVGHPAPPPGPKHPTRLQDGKTLDDHDDWDCLMDMEAFGLVEVISYVLGWIRLTDYGMMVAQALRNHKASGGSFGNFRYETPVKAHAS